ncbi:MAG: hypothetical protein CMQ36_11420 [Gammaproteobacteria bacterium]|jgi:uncharacterized protein YheU (UPF0270 family)|nr:hypothetical protein [Gammaproteobacteria bacterium]MCH2351826.1 YheU family protein [Pseudomonadales bacterium]HAO54410.1 hypothetical protein [Gammaproteobacteria bacterium]|tara:strand:+ start:1013 stop:1225 length:213 start_codon:yes stop_codon:yes gene_type:complete
MRANVIEIPYLELSEMALESIIDEYVTRDSGIYNGSLSDKRALIVMALQKSEVVITFDPVSGSTDIVEKR